jgi:DNA modification methylase
VNSPSHRIIEGDCEDVLPTLPDRSFDTVITDPPYPGIKLDYGTWSEAEWQAMMLRVVQQCKRLLKPKGSAVFILQPNRRKVGRMRTWLWDFMAWVGRDWGIVQDVYWWNTTALPAISQDRHGLRQSVKTCVWCGPPDCYRNADNVLLTEAEASRARRLSGRCTNKLGKRAGNAHVRDLRAYRHSIVRGGSTPFNLLAIPAGADQSGRHPAKTPIEVARWWARYLCKPGMNVLDPFCGSGTMGVAAIECGCDFVGVERMAEYIPGAEARLAEAF